MTNEIEQTISGGCHKCGNDITGNLTEGKCLGCGAEYWFTACYGEDDLLRAVLKSVVTTIQTKEATNGTLHYTPQ